MTNPKWEIGPVKLVCGYDAIIDAIYEDQERFRYIGRVKRADSTWESCGWHANGKFMFGEPGHGFTLAPPPKKTVRVRCWLNVDACGATGLLLDREDADRLASANRIACIEISRIVTEGEGL